MKSTMINKIINEQEKKILYRFFYVLLRPGVLGVKNVAGKEVKWRVARPSSVNSVVAFDMDMACKKIRKALSNKEKKGFTGFQMLDVKEDRSR